MFGIFDDLHPSTSVPISEASSRQILDRIALLKEYLLHQELVIASPNSSRHPPGVLQGFIKKSEDEIEDLYLLYIGKLKQERCNQSSSDKVFTTELDRMPKAGDIWRHFQGTDYEIIGVSNSQEIPFDSLIDYWAEDTETKKVLGIYHLEGSEEKITITKIDGLTPIAQEMVVYFTQSSAKVYASPLDNFLETLGDTPTWYYRFQKVISK